MGDGVGGWQLLGGEIFWFSEGSENCLIPNRLGVINPSKGSN